MNDNEVTPTGNGQRGKFVFLFKCKRGHRLTLEADAAARRGQGAACPTCFKPMFVAGVERG